MVEYAKDMWVLATEGEKQGVLFFVVIYAFAVCLYSFLRQVLITQWPVAKGFLKSASVEEWGSTTMGLSFQDYKADSLYVYQVSEKTYQGKRVSPWVIVASHNARFLIKGQLNNIKENDDGTVDVFYNPRKPEKSYLVKPGFFGMVITFGIAVLPLYFYLNAYL